MNNIKKNIEKLIESDQPSNYAIHKETGIAQSTLSDVRIGKMDIGNLKLDQALKLNEFYLKNFHKNP